MMMAKRPIYGRYRVFLCTSPVLSSRHCAQDKYDWVRAHLGPDAVAYEIRALTVTKP